MENLKICQFLSWECCVQGREEDRVSTEKFIYYLERHVEVDGDEHGPAALNMIKVVVFHRRRIYTEEKAKVVAAS